MSGSVHEDVQDYYGKRLQTTGDLSTNVCTVDKTAYSSEAKEAMKMIHPAVLEKWVVYMRQQILKI